MATFTEPCAWFIDLHDDDHLVELEGWQVGITGSGVVRGQAGQVCVDGRPVPHEVVVPRGYVFAYLEREWRFTIGGHSCVIKQGMAGVPIWDLWVDGRRIPHAPMSRRRIVQTVGQFLLALAFAAGCVALTILLVVRLMAMLGPPGR